MENTILLSKSDATAWPGCPFPGGLQTTGAKVFSMAEFTKEEIEQMVQDAVMKAMRGVFAVGLTEVVHCAVTKAMQNYEHECVLDLSPKEVEAAQTLIDVAKATGHGDVTAGVEEIRENHVFICRLRKKLDKAGDTVTSCVLKAVMTVLLAATGLGLIFLFFIKNNSGPGAP